MSELDAAAERLVVELGAAFQQRAVYAGGHPQTVRAIERALAAHRQLLAVGDGVETTLLLVEDALVVDRRPLPEGVPWTRGLLTAFGRLGVSGLTLAAGLDAAELSAYLDRAAEGDGATGSRHLVVGHAGVAGAADGGREGGAAGVAPPPPALVSPEELAAATAEIRALAAGAARASKLREVVATVARAMIGARTQPLTARDSTPEERELAHGLATAVGALALGRALGLPAEPLEALGLAALLHDVGKLAVPAEERSTAAALRRHPALGAARLAATPGLPDVVPLVAFEHHLRWDGAPNYPELAEPRRPSGPAAIVAVADTWDTLRGPGGASTADAVAMLRERAGTFLHPGLVELFVRLVG